MKKKLLTIIAILLVTVMAGCAAIATENDVESKTGRAQSGAVTKDTVSAQQTTKTSEQVKQIAFDHAKVKEADVKDLEVELDKDNGTLHFDVSFDAGDYDYEYEIDAYSGKILHSEKEKEVAETKPVETKPATTEKKQLSKSAVKKIAFDHAKVKEANVKDLEVELDKDDGKLHYDISFESGSYDYDYDIDAYSGKILKSEKERDDDNVKKTSTTTTTTTKTKKTVAQVKKIALDHAKVKEASARDLEVELDKEGSKVYYEVTFESGGYDYEYEIDAYSGKILHSEKEKDD